MLRDGRLRKIEFLHDVAAAAGVLPCQMLQDFDARRMRQRGEARSQPARAGVRHDEKFRVQIIHRLSSIDDELLARTSGR